MHISGFLAGQKKSSVLCRPLVDAILCPRISQEEQVMNPFIRLDSCEAFVLEER